MEAKERMALEAQIAQLQLEVKVLKEENQTLRDKVEFVFDEVMPIVDEIDENKGWFKIAKWFKLVGVLLSKLIELSQKQ